MNMPLVLLNRRRRGSVAFNPISLFSAGEQGFWLEPSDLTTMFTDRAGTTPVTTPGTVVGLRLDKSKGATLEPNSAPGDGTFDSATEWTLGGSATVTGGKLVFSGGAGGYAQYSTTIPAGTYVRYSIDKTVLGASGAANVQLRFRSGTTTVLAISLGGTNGPITSSALVLITSACDNVDVNYNGTGAYQYEFDNLSVRELPGNHAVAPTDAARPTYGIEPKTGRRNLLTRTEEFGDAVWTKANLTVSANAGVAPDGTTTADRLVESAANIGRGTYFTNTTTVSGNTTWSVYLKAAERNFGGLTAIDGGNNRYYLVANLTNGAEIASGSASGSPSLVSKSIISVGNGWYRLQITLNSVSGATNFGWVYPQDDATFATESTGNAIYQGDGTSGILIWGAQLELGSTATAYQRVGTAFDVTEAGVPTVHYVQYDGTDDSFSTSSIDFSATDKMSVFAGVRKLSDAAQGVLAELSATIVSNNGSFLLAAPDGATATFGFDSKGTAQVDAVASSLTAPITRLVTGLADIAGDTATIRINGVQADQDTGDQGTGNYGNYPLFLGRRNNASLPFNGRDYGIIIVGKTASATEITNTESYLAANTSGVSI